MNAVQHSCSDFDRAMQRYKYLSFSFLAGFCLDDKFQGFFVVLDRNYRGGIRIHNYLLEVVSGRPMPIRKEGFVEPCESSRLMLMVGWL